ncbi:MAG: S24 family peptidase [Chthoniobacteraceae bacterium]
MPFTATCELTPAQRRVASAIAKLHADGRPGFVPELIEELGLAAESSLSPTLRIMERNGFVEVHGGGAGRAHRVVRLTAKGALAIGAGGLPVLGTIPAGPLAEAFSRAEDIVEPGGLLKTRAGDFLLRVRGESMIGDGIHDGDLVLLRPDIGLQAGEIAAVHAGESYESTLKHVHFEQGQVRLRASNPDFEDIIVRASDWRGIAGVYRGLVRHVGR